MKEHPILFSGEMVRAILDGRKTQTRRIVKHIPMLGEPLAWCAAAAAQEPGWLHIVGDYRRFCPYGQPGDRLWVRETWCCKMDSGEFVYRSDGHHECLYRATEPFDITKDDGDGGTEHRKDGRQASPWVPSIHMPRWASRLTLEITSIRVERLNDISEEDAKAEGVKGTEPKSAFGLLWSTINGYNSWTSNPWVWVVAFKRI